MSAEGLRWRWERAFRNAKFSASVKAVGFTLATYANSDGTKAHPGSQRLAQGASVSARAVSTAMGTLRECGWITLVREAVPQAGKASEYRLCIPTTGAVSAPTPSATGANRVLTRVQPVHPTGTELTRSISTPSGGASQEQGESAAGRNLGSTDVTTYDELLRWTRHSQDHGELVTTRQVYLVVNGEVVGGRLAGEPVAGPGLSALLKGDPGIPGFD